MRKTIFSFSIVIILLCLLCACSSENYSKVGERNNPVAVGETAINSGIIDYKTREDFKLEMTVTKVIRGNEAREIIESSEKDSYFNRKTPDENEEYILVKFKIKILKSHDGQSVKPNDFCFVSKSGVKYDFVSTDTVKPIFQTVFPEAETEGFVCGIVDKNDTPMVVFAENYSGGFWFQTQTNAYEIVE